MTLIGKKSRGFWLDARAHVCWWLLKAALKVDPGFPEKALVLIGTNTPEILKTYVRDRAGQMSIGIVMTILDREGIRHCSRCPQRFGLRKSESGYVCMNHDLKEEKATAA